MSTNTSFTITNTPFIDFWLSTFSEDSPIKLKCFYHPDIQDQKVEKKLTYDELVQENTTLKYQLTKLKEFAEVLHEKYEFYRKEYERLYDENGKLM